MFIPISKRNRCKPYRWKHCLRFIGLGALVLSLGASRAEAFRPISFLSGISGNLHSVDAGVFRNHLSLDASMGSVLSGGVYFGAVGDVWFASQGEGVAQVNLGYMSAGIELGIVRSRERHFWFFGFAALYPFALQVSNPSGAVTEASTKPLSYRGRALVGIRVSESTALTLGAGYRYAPMGPFGAGVAPVPTGLSGIVWSAGLAATL